MPPCCRGEPDRTGNLLLSHSQTAFAMAMVGMIQLLEEVRAQPQQEPDADAEEDPEIFSQNKRQKVRDSSTRGWLCLCDERPVDTSAGQAADCEWQWGMAAITFGNSHVIAFHAAECHRQYHLKMG